MLTLLFALSFSSGCLLLSGRNWDDTRRQVIEPINSVVHRHLARDIGAKHLEAVLEAYATDIGTGLTWKDPDELPDLFAERRFRWNRNRGQERIRERYEHLFRVFDIVERAEVRIHRIYWDHRDGAGFPADVHVIVRGFSPTGDLSMLDQWTRIRLDERNGAWRITEEEVLWRELLRSTKPRFEPVTEKAALVDIHDTEGSPRFRLVGDTFVSSGSAVADINCDGLQDIALLSASRLALYRNRGDRTFEPVSAQTGLPTHVDVAGTGLVFFDADNDGDPDLWVCGIHGDRFFENRDCSFFVDATVGAGNKPTRWSSMPIVADYDRDGYLDVYVVRMGDHETSAPKPNWDARNGVPDTLYRNNGDGTFTDVTAPAGITAKGWGLAGAWGDYNNDGYPDLYVGNEFGTNILYRNERDGTFTDVTGEAGVEDRGAAMGVAWADYDNDGDLDLFVSNMYANSRWALFHPEFPPPVPWYFSWVPLARVHEITDELTRGSTLLRNNSDGTFTDVSSAAGVRDTQWAWGAEFLDYDNDGWLDLWVTNGMVSGHLTDDV